jgi:hypothetical protein
MVPPGEEHLHLTMEGKRPLRFVHRKRRRQEEHMSNWLTYGGSHKEEEQVLSSSY